MCGCGLCHIGTSFLPDSRLLQEMRETACWRLPSASCAIGAESALLTKDDSRFDSADARFGTPNAEVVDSAPKDDALEVRSFVETVCAMIMVAERKGFEPSIRF